MTDLPYHLAMWQREPPLVDESEFTVEAPRGWHAWAGTDGMPAELEFCEFMASLVRLLRPGLVFETGVGTGFATRRIVKSLPRGSSYLGFESNDEWRRDLNELPFFSTSDHVQLSPFPTPDTFADVDLTLLDSDIETRVEEIATWGRTADPRAIVVVHDTKAYPVGQFPMAIQEAGLTGVWLTNPRGCFVGSR